MWNLDVLQATPAIWDAAPSGDDAVHALFFEGVSWRGRPTRVFAYYGIPETTPGERVPGMVLVHGGGGSAFIPWVKLWMSRGYAAIAMDTCGCISGGGYENHPRHAFGGPSGWGGFAQISEPPHDQWTYHAVADVVLAHSLLRSFAPVDPARIGLTGVSWGGYLTCITAAVDPRFAFAAPVYGCGFLGDNSAWLGEFQRMGTESAAHWLAQWDPSVYLPRVHVPMLWVNGTNDFAYPMDSWQQSYRLPPAARTLSLQVRMPHGHGGPGENPVEIHAFADHLLRGGAALPHITASGRDGRRLILTFASEVLVERAELNYTTDSGPWVDRQWQTTPAYLDAVHATAGADVPENAIVGYLKLVDARGAVISSEHETFSAA